MTQKLDAILTELAKRKNKPFRLEDYLFPEQLAFVNDPSQFAAAVTSRRAGKTTSCAADLTDTVHQSDDGSVSLYLTLSRANAKRILWAELKRLDKRHGLGGVFNESELSLVSPHGGTLYLSGASDRTEIEKFRGLALKKVYIDEGQSFPAYFEELVDDVLVPGLMDYAGKLRVIGTPGPIPVGYFYDLSGSKGWSHHHWTFFNNPHIARKSGKTHQEILESELKRRGVSISDPTVQREWFGKWVLDSDSLVYRYTKEINNYETLPKATWNYILGVDLGFNDADALAVLAWSEASNCTFLVEELVTRKQGTTELVIQIESLRKKYNISKIIVDQGGLGKKIAEEMQRRYAIPVQAAEKTRKVEYIELMNDALRTGRLKAKASSQFAEECMKVEWDHDKSTPDKRVISKRFHSDICEAVLYAWRESYSYTHKEEPKKPAEGTREHEQAMAEELYEKALEYALAQEEANREDY